MQKFSYDRCSLFYIQEKTGKLKFLHRLAEMSSHWMKCHKASENTVGANAVFCQQEVRFYQLAVRSAPISPKEQRLYPLVEVLMD